MIKSERQYRTTKSQAAKFKSALKALASESGKDRKTHPHLLKAQKDAMHSQLESLQRELRDYEGLDR